MWLLSGECGTGKARAGAEWVRWAALQAGYRRAALVAPSVSDVREVMIEGPSGLMATARHAGDRPIWQPSRHRLGWKNGAVAYGFSAEDPGSLRGPQFDLAWCDEASARARGEAVWDILQMALRLGPQPLAMVTTTPRAAALIRRLKVDPMVVETRTRMADNAANLAPGFPEIMRAAYGGAMLERPELDGEMIDDSPGVMFVRSRIDELRVADAPLVLDDCIVAVDPCVTAGAEGERLRHHPGGRQGRGGLCDGRCLGAGAETARLGGARRAPRRDRRRLNAPRRSQPRRRHGARGEFHDGHHHAGAPRCRRLGEKGRAQPIAALYQHGCVHHAGTFHTPEDQMCRFGTLEETGSPDRVDALVWALMVEGRGPRVRVVA